MTQLSELRQGVGYFKTMARELTDMRNSDDNINIKLLHIELLFFVSSLFIKPSIAKKLGIGDSRSLNVFESTLCQIDSFCIPTFE